MTAESSPLSLSDSSPYAIITCCQLYKPEQNIGRIPAIVPGSGTTSVSASQTISPSKKRNPTAAPSMMVGGSKAKNVRISPEGSFLGQPGKSMSMVIGGLTTATLYTFPDDSPFNEHNQAQPLPMMVEGISTTTSVLASPDTLQVKHSGQAEPVPIMVEGFTSTTVLLPPKSLKPDKPTSLRLPPSNFEGLTTTSLYISPDTLQQNEEKKSAKRSNGSERKQLWISRESLLPRERNQAKLVSKIVKDLTTTGVCILDSFLSALGATDVWIDALTSYVAGEFHQGLLKDGPSGHCIDTGFRGDVMKWCSGDEDLCVNELVSEVLQLVSNALNTGSLGEKRIRAMEIMMSCYPGRGERFGPHRDSEKDEGRFLTAIFYLNMAWKKDNGGELIAACTNGDVYTIAPIFNRLVLFWSEKIRHEVRPVYHDSRFSVVIFMRDR